jgi:hypothetical protein
MNPIRTIGRLACTLTGLTAALATAVAVAPAASAATRPSPPPGELSRFEPVAHTFNGVTGGMTGWQITLLVAGAMLLAAALAATAYRIRSGRQRVSTTVA